MLQPRTKSAPESTGPAAAKPDSGKPRAGRPLGDRVRSLSLADLPEHRFSASMVLGWVLVLALIGAAGWYWWSSRSAAAKALAAKTLTEQKSSRPSNSKVDLAAKPIDSTPATGAAEKTPVRPATYMG